MFDSHRSYVLRQIRILDPQSDIDRIGDIWIDRGTVAAIAFPLTSIPEGAEVIDAQDWVIGPGLVDLYAQPGEPGFEQRETFESLGKAALAGGFTQVALLPNTHPVVDDGDRVQAIGDRTHLGMTPQWHPLAAVTQGAKGTTLTELAELAAAGAAGFCDGYPLGDLMLLRRLLEYSQMLNKPLLLWPQSRQLAGGAMLEGEWSARLGVVGISPMAEPTAVAQILELVRETGTPVHLMRLSQARSFQLVAQAQVDGVSVTTSTSWMHCLLADRDIQKLNYHPALHLHTPLGTEGDREAAVAALRDGVLTAIATDHSPYTFEEKTVPFALAPPGAIGLELALPLLWHGLVEGEHLSGLQLWRGLSTGPARVLGLPAVSMDLHQPANLTILALNNGWTVGATTLQSLSAATPWWGETITGKVLGCWVQGQWQDSGTD